MGWKFWEKKITIEEMLPSKATENVSYRTIEAYTITPLGIERLIRENNPTLSYDGAQILGAVKKGKCTIGELADVCSHLYAPSGRKELEMLVEEGLIRREDVEIRMQTKYRGK